MTFDASVGLSAFEWCINASFVLHLDFWSHTGSSVKFGGGQGCPISVSAKQKSNVDSSVIAELTVAGQLPPLVVFYVWNNRDNQQKQIRFIKMTMVSHHWRRAAKEVVANTHTHTYTHTHIHTLYVCYSMVIDLIKKGQVGILCCSVDNVTGNYFTRVLQGTKFSTF